MTIPFLPSWMLPVIVSALALGFYDIFKKHAVRENSVMPALFFSTLTGTLFFLLVMFLKGDLAGCMQCSNLDRALIGLKALLVAASWTCVFYAMRELPISIASPIRASSPVWTFIASLVLYMEIPNWIEGMGMLVIFGGYYLFSVFGNQEGFSFRKSKGIHLIILGTLIGSGCAICDKYLLGVVKIPPRTVQFYFAVYLVGIFGITWLVRSFFGQKRPFQFRWSVPLTGIMLILSDMLYFHSLSLPGTYVSFISLVRRCSCVVTFAAGVIFFKEKNIKRKAIALALILLGVFLLAMGH
jgi:drug/metabolite transporter (DMT)-like permease